VLCYPPVHNIKVILRNGIGNLVTVIWMQTQMKLNLKATALYELLS